MRTDTNEQNVLSLRYRERRFLVASSALVLIGILLAGGTAEHGLLAAAFAAPAYGVHLVWTRTRHGADPLLLPLLHLLSGIGMLLMLSIGGLELAWQFVIGSALGCAAFLGASLIDLRRRFWRRQHGVWLVGALGIVFVLFAAGSGPAGSAARVNLDVPRLGRIQPIEIVKLCLMLFMAGYFARNWRFLRELRERRALPRWVRRLDVPRLRDVWPVTVGVAMTLASCFVLRDMGPALVLGSTFLVLYGMARGKWWASAAGFAAMIGGFWAIYATGVVPIVADRMSMLLSPWDNLIEGGEHLAHAYWAMAAGGVTGTGLGSGSAWAVPAAHTDMVLPAVAEELGLVGLLGILAIYVTLFVRIFRIARRSSATLGVFLAAGAGLMLLFQLFLIAGGTTGLAPLSGIVTPFLSYGKSSMLVNCGLLGLVASVSAREAATHDAETRRFGTPLRLASALTIVLLAAVGARAVQIQLFRADAWAVKPALVLRDSGERAFAYNPRIFAAREALGLGTIRDRNGIVLAADRPDSTVTRGYPFGAATFYLLGDVNRRVKWGADNSFYAEHRFLSFLRGYDNHPSTVRVDGHDVVRYDYSELLPLIGSRRRSPAAQAMLARDRDLDLTIDVRLQEEVIGLLAEGTPEGLTSSAVVLDAATGEVLASATHPAPALDHPADVHADPSAFDRGFGEGAKPPGSTFKLVTAMAALGIDPSSRGWTHTVRSWDRYARRGEPTGEVGMRRAIVSSSNVYFAALAHEVVGAERLLAALETFGFRIGPPGLTHREKIELLKAPDNLRQVGFGQGPLVGGPLQVARVAAAVANGGRIVPARWIRTAGAHLSYDHPSNPDSPNPDSRNPDALSPDSSNRFPSNRREGSEPVHLRVEDARFLAGAMRGVITDARGTARSLRTSSVPIAGKTGTAEEDGKQNHAWFAAFAPYEASGGETERSYGAPEGRRGQTSIVSATDRGSVSATSRRKIAVGVLVEEGGNGSSVAAPIARAIIEAAAELGIIAQTDSPPSITDRSTPLGRTTLISSSDR